jgi:hypothetical protein
MSVIMIVPVMVQPMAVQVPARHAVIMPQAASCRRQQIGQDRNSGRKTMDEHCDASEAKNRPTIAVTYSRPPVISQRSSYSITIN